MAISHKILQIGVYLILFTKQKSYVGFLMPPLTSTYSDLERSTLRSCISRVAISRKILQISIYILLFTDRKSYLGFIIAPSTLIVNVKLI